MPLSYGEEHDLDPRWILDILARDFKPRANPRAAPTVSIFAEPRVCLTVNAEWYSHISGYIAGLLEPDAWLGDDTEQRRIYDEISTLLEGLDENCMVDPCCDETNESLDELQDQTGLLLLQAYTQQFNNWTTTNNSQANYNQMFYNGSPNSISPNLGANFNTTGGNAALCEAISRYIENLVYAYTMRVNLAATAFAGGAAAAVVLGSILTGGLALPLLGAWGLLSTTAVTVAAAVWNAIVADVEGKRKVYCCMFDSLQDQAITQEIFKTSVEDCGFDPTTSEGRIAGLIQNENQSDANYLAFIRLLGDQQGGSEEPCNCGCDITTYNIIAMDNCTVEKLTDTTYRITQTNIDPSDPARPNARTALIRDEFYRCFKIVDEGLQGQSDSSYADCDNVDHYSLGGFEGAEGIRFQFRQWENDIDTIIEIDCTGA